MPYFNFRLKPSVIAQKIKEAIINHREEVIRRREERKLMAEDEDVLIEAPAPIKNKKEQFVP